MPLRNASHFPPFKQVCTGLGAAQAWGGARGEVSLARTSRGTAYPSPPVMGLLGAGAPRKPCMNPKGAQHSAHSSGIRDGTGRNRLAGWQVERSRSKWVEGWGG